MMAPSTVLGAPAAGAHPKDAALRGSPPASQPKPATITGVLPNWPGSGSCWSAVQGKLCRIERVFVAEPDVPADNNPAERSRRHLVISRKVSGGTRSERGTGTWCKGRPTVNS